LSSVTVVSTGPAEPAGVVAVIDVALLTITEVAGSESELDAARRGEPGPVM